MDGWVDIRTNVVCFSCHGDIKHIQIMRYQDGLFGFSEELRYPSLESLIIEHSHVSLEKYNSELPTPLLFPVFGQRR